MPRRSSANVFQSAWCRPVILAIPGPSFERTGLRVLPISNVPPSSTPRTTLGSAASTGNGGGGNRRPKALAQPMGPTWLASHTAAASEAQQVEDLKLVNHRINEELKKTIDIHFYYKVGSECISYATAVDSYPNLRMETVPLLMNQLQLKKESILSVWNGRWETKTPSSVITGVNKSRPVIMVLRSSLLEDINTADYPGLEEEIKSQRGPGAKRAAEIDLVSPLKKTPRQAGQSSVQHPSDFPSTSTSNSLPIIQPNPIPSTSTQPPVAPASSPVPYHSTSVKDCAYINWVESWKRIKMMLDDDPKMTEALAVPIVFGGTYHKSTVCMYKNHVKKASESLKTAFLSYGNSPRASMTRFSTAYNEEKKKHLSIKEEPEHATPIPTIPAPFQPSLPSARLVPLVLSPTSTLQQPQDASFLKAAPFLSQTPAISEPLPLHSSPASTPASTSQQPQDAAISETAKTPSSAAPFPAPSPLNGAFPPNIKLEPVDHEALHGLLEDTPGVNGIGLCPYCDEDFPESPSPKLLEWCKALHSQTYPAPSLENPLHRSADSFRIYIEFCAHHRFESNHLPLALSEGWPQDPDFAPIFDRVCRSFLFLSSVAASGVNEFLVEAKEHRKGGSGTLKDFASGRFLESGAGYYGEPGYRIIMSALRYLFPPSSINSIDIHPLTHEIFLRDVLAHEAAVRLIQVDLEISREEAIATFRKSCQFGNIQHSTDTKDGLDKYDIHIAAAIKRSSTATRHEDSCYRRWIASGSPLWIDEWLSLVNQQMDQLSDEEMRIKEEEMDLDPFADQPEGEANRQSVIFSGAGFSNDPIDLTLDDD